MTRKELVIRMITEGIKIVAIAESLNITRQFVYRIKRGHTAKEKQYRRHFEFSHKYNEDCPFCIQEKAESVNP